MSGLPFFFTGPLCAAVNKLRGVPLLMNYNVFNGGGRRRRALARRRGGICSVVKIFSCKAKSAAPPPPPPRWRHGLLKKEKKTKKKNKVRKRLNKLEFCTPPKRYCNTRGACLSSPKVRRVRGICITPPPPPPPPARSPSPLLLPDCARVHCVVAEEQSPPH